MRLNPVLRVSAVGICALLLAACGSSSTPSGTTSPTGSSTSGASGAITVFAAASLK